MKEAVEQIKWLDEKTNTSGAIEHAHKMFTLENGDRTFVQNVMIVVTDGTSNVDQFRVKTVADAAKAASKEATNRRTHNISHGEPLANRNTRCITRQWSLVCQ